MKHIADVINKEIESQILLGASVGIWKRGKRVYREDFGYLDFERKTRMPDNAIFRLYSSTKPITAVAAMILVERGVIDLFDPVSKYLSGFEHQKVYENGKIVPAQKPSTIAELLNMTSGLAYTGDTILSQIDMKGVFDRGIKAALGGKGFSTIELCNQMGRVPLIAQPGTEWHYGTSADVLGAVIEIASEKRFSDFLKDEIFVPLQMLDTDFYVPKEKRSRLHTMCEYDESTASLREYKGHELLILCDEKQPEFESGGAGLFSTVEDYSHFSNMLLLGGEWNGVRILGKKTVEFMRSNQLTKQQIQTFCWPEMRGCGYGCLMSNVQDIGLAGPYGSVGQFGWSGWAGTYAAMDVQENVMYEIFISRVAMDPGALQRKVRSIIYGNL